MRNNYYSEFRVDDLIHKINDVFESGIRFVLKEKYIKIALLELCADGLVQNRFDDHGGSYTYKYYCKDFPEVIDEMALSKKLLKYFNDDTVLTSKDIKVKAEEYTLSTIEKRLNICVNNYDIIKINYNDNDYYSSQIPIEYKQKAKQFRRADKRIQAKQAEIQAKQAEIKKLSNSLKEYKTIDKENNSELEYARKEYESAGLFSRKKKKQRFDYYYNIKLANDGRIQSIESDIQKIKSDISRINGDILEFDQLKIELEKEMALIQEKIINQVLKTKKDE